MSHLTLSCDCLIIGITPGPLFSEDDAGTINDREVFINKFSSERDSKKFNVMPEKKPLPADIQSAFVVQIKSVFKCRLCPRIICLTEDTLRNHLQSKVLHFLSGCTISLCINLYYLCYYSLRRMPYALNYCGPSYAYLMKC